MIDAMSVWNGLAMASGQGGEGAGGGGDLMGMLLPMALIFGVFYIMMIRPQQRKEKERRRMIENVKKGDRVMFGGGLFGTVVNAKDQTLVIKVADNVKVEAARGAVSRVFAEGEKIGETSEGK